MEGTLAGPQVAHRRSSAILPIFAIGNIAELQSNEKRIFLLYRIAHFRQRIITSDLRHGHITCAQCPANDRRCVLDAKSLTKSFSISLGHRSIHAGSSCFTPFAMLAM
jgi:hypothetical protein